MKLAEAAIRAKIDQALNGKFGELYRKLSHSDDPYQSSQLREQATKEINSLSNIELLELIDSLPSK